jgi:type II restriction enzyme
MKFENFLNSLKESNETLDFFVDFEKVKRNVSKIEIKLHQLNYLIGKKI